MENKKPASWTEIMDGWANASNSYFLVECKAVGQRLVCKGFEGLSHYLKWKRLYGTVGVTITALDKSVGEVLYGNAVQDE